MYIYIFYPTNTLQHKYNVHRTPAFMAKRINMIVAMPNCVTKSSAAILQMRRKKCSYTPQNAAHKRTLPNSKVWHKVSDPTRDVLIKRLVIFL